MVNLNIGRGGEGGEDGRLGGVGVVFQVGQLGSSYGCSCGRFCPVLYPVNDIEFNNCSGAWRRKKSIVKKPGRMDVDVPVPSLGHTLIVSTVYLRLIEYTPIGSAKFVHACSSERKLGQVS